MNDSLGSKTRRGWLWSFAPLFLWIGVIFYLSSSSGSMTETSRFVRPLLEFLFPSATEDVLLNYHFYIRKLAHITEYAILGFLAMRAFLGTASPFAIASIIVVLVAAADEFNQSFQSSRTSSAGDVLLDCIGGMLAIGIYLTTRWYFAKPAETSLPSTP